MKNVKFDDGVMSRGRRKFNFIAMPTEGVAVKFVGKSLPGCRVVREDFHKNGKWSKNIWECELDDRLVPLVIAQNFDTSEFFPETTWETACARHDLLSALSSPTSVEQFIRANFPQNAIRFDRERENVKATGDVAETMKKLAAAELEKAEANRMAAEAEFEAKAVKEMEREISSIQWHIDCAGRSLAAARDLLARKEEIDAQLTAAKAELAAVEAELAAAAKLREQQEELAATERKLGVLKAAKGKKMSLADLQSMLKST